MDISVKASTLTSLVLSGTVKGLQLYFWIVLLFTIDFIGFFAEVQFIVMVNALKIRFEVINEKLEDLFSVQNLKIEYRIKHFADTWQSEQALAKSVVIIANASTVLPIFNKRVRFINTIYVSPLQVRPVENFRKDFESSLLYRNAFQNTEETGSASGQTNIPFTIYLLRLSHRNLSIAFDSLNSMFEYMLLISIFTRFLMILGNSYFAIFGFDKVFILSHRWDVLFWLLKCLFRFVSQLVMSDLLSEAVSTLNCIVFG